MSRKTLSHQVIAIGINYSGIDTKMTEITSDRCFIGRQFDRLIWLKKPDQALWNEGLISTMRCGGLMLAAWPTGDSA